MKAREALAAHLQTLAELNAQTTPLTHAAKLEEWEELERAKRADWEREVVLFDDSDGKVTAAATWPSGSVLAKWTIGVGFQGELLAAYEVTNYKGGRIVTDLRSFDGVPVEVELAVFRRYNLKKRA